MTMTNFESHIQASIPVVVEFYAKWSDQSRLMSPIMKEVYEKVGDRATVLRVDIDQEPEIATQYGVGTVPSVIIFKEGHILWQKNGITPAHEILEHLSQVIE